MNKKINDGFEELEEMLIMMQNNEIGYKIEISGADNIALPSPNEFYSKAVAKLQSLKKLVGEELSVKDKRIEELKRKEANRESVR